jgi:predicted ester cyclase
MSFMIFPSSCQVVERAGHCRQRSPEVVRHGPRGGEARHSNRDVRWKVKKARRDRYFCGVSLDANKEVVRSFYAEAMGSRDAYACERWLSKGFVHNGVKRGRDGQREVVAYFLAAFEPLEHEIRLLLAEGDLVAAHQRWRGRQVGEFLGRAASGREIVFTSTAVLRIAGGEIVEAWDEMDTGPILEQIDAPAPG